MLCGPVCWGLCRWRRIWVCIQRCIDVFGGIGMVQLIVCERRREVVCNRVGGRSHRHGCFRRPRNGSAQSRVIISSVSVQSKLARRWLQEPRCRKLWNAAMQGRWSCRNVGDATLSGGGHEGLANELGGSSALVGVHLEVFISTFVSWFYSLFMLFS